jgi:hypothetical protein
MPAAGSFGASDPVLVSLVEDRCAGAPAHHGFEKLKFALEARKITVEVAPTLEDARGRFLAVAGLDSRVGAAAELLKLSAAAAPTSVESLLVRKMEWKGRPSVAEPAFGDGGSVRGDAGGAEGEGRSRRPSETNEKTIAERSGGMIACKSHEIRSNLIHIPVCRD